ncbi:MAG: shikimate kinase, partial [Bacteroidetes bacterium]|nr:shikimate kinase [Bacteroidota bacterium]
MCSGKSTICPLLAQKLDLPHYPLDMLRWYYHLKAGYKILEAEKVRRQGLMEYLSYMEPFRID